MMGTFFKLGIIGGGLNSLAGYPHFVASQMDRRFSVESGVFSRNANINKATAEYWKVKRYYHSIDEFIEKEKGKVDAVSVLLPTPDHFIAVKKLLENNIPVICEKPLCSNLEEIEQLEEVENVEGKFLVITYNYLAYPILSELRRRIMEGFLGEVINVHLEMPLEAFLRPPRSVEYPPAWRKKDGDIPGILLDLASHLFSLLYYLTDKKVETVFSHFNSFSPYGVVDDAKMVLKLSDGASGFMWISKVALGNRNGMKASIYGKKASGVWIQEDPEKLYISDMNGRRQILDRGSNIPVSKVKIFNRMMPGHPSGYIESFGNLYFEIANVLESYSGGKFSPDNPLIWTLDKEKVNFKFLHAAVESADKVKEINVSNPL